MKTIKDYLYEVTVHFKSLGEVQTRTIFLMALRDYLNNAIDVKVLSCVASKLYYVLNKPFDVDSKFEHDLAHLLQDAAELEYHSNEAKKESLNETLGNKILKDLRDYYQKNEFVLDNILSDKAS
ncbi:hypothetical protein M1555_04395 [Patescibacteria group bacterium]|nr:hypothetical protein [Patescibacteria group bacterium]